MPPQVDVILPCLNEQDALPALLAAFPPGYRAIVVDNASTDATAEVAKIHGATVVSETRRGFGAAAHAGLEAATADIVAFCDGDGSFDPEELPRVCDPVREGTADLVLGRRMPTEKGAWPVHARIANAYLARRLRSITGADIHDLGPMRAANREALLGLGMQDRRSGYPLEMVLRAAEQKWRFAEVEVSYHPRVGRSKVTGTVRGTLTAISDMSALLREVRA